MPTGAICVPLESSTWSVTRRSHASFHRKRQPASHPRCAEPSHLSCPRWTVFSICRGCPRAHVLSALLETRRRRPQNASISGMNGKPSSLPSLARLDTTSATLLTSTKSPGSRAIAARSNPRTPFELELTAAFFDRSPPLAVDPEAAFASSIVYTRAHRSITGAKIKQEMYLGRWLETA